MGTHPIFESDFDCLTDKMALNADATSIKFQLEQCKTAIDRTATGLGDICTLISSINRKQAKIRDKGDALATAAVEYAQSDLPTVGWQQCWLVRISRKSYDIKGMLFKCLLGHRNLIINLCRTKCLLIFHINNLLLI